MVIRSSRHIPHIISDPPRSLQNGHMLDLVNKKVATHNRLLAEKSIKEKTKQPAGATKAPAFIQQKKVLPEVGKKKQLTGAEKALKATPKLTKPTKTPHKIASPFKGKKIASPALGSKPGLKVKKLPHTNLLDKSAKTPIPPQAKSDDTHLDLKKIKDLQKLSGGEKKKTKFGKLKQKAILKAAMPKSPKPIHKSLLAYTKPPEIKPR